MIDLSLLRRSFLRDLSLCHGDGDVESILRARHISLILAHDVECCAVSGRSHRHRQAALNSDSAVERQEFHGNLALVVVHCDDAVEVLALQEDGITRIWSLDIDATLSSRRYSRTNVIDLFASKRSILTVVRVQCTYC